MTAPDGWIGSHSRAAALVSCVLMGVVGTACSPQAPPPIASNLLQPAGPACDRHMLSAADLAGILRVPITDTKPLPGDAQSCEYTTAAYPGIIVSLRPGVGRATVEAWTTGKMPLESTPLTGVGDSAVWQRTLQEVIAEKNGVLCDIQVRGGGSDIAMDPKALPAALGALCNRIFAAT